MVSEKRFVVPMLKELKVLILVLVEDGLGACINRCYDDMQVMVLILVLVEDGLGVAQPSTKGEKGGIVLILVLVEDGLGAPPEKTAATTFGGLNPCFSGGWSRRATFGIGCQRDCCNEIFNFVNVWRPKICTFSGAFTGANIRIIFVNGAFFDAGFRAIFAFLSAMGRRAGIGGLV